MVSGDARVVGAARRSSGRVLSAAWIVALLASGLLLAGCTPRTATPSRPPASPLTTPGTPVVKVHVTVRILADLQSTVHYSDGLTTRTAVAHPSSGVATIEFDAPRPWVVAATATTAEAGPLGCSIEVDGRNVANSQPTDQFIMCLATEGLLNVPRPKGRHEIEMTSTRVKGGGGWEAYATAGGAYSRSSGASNPNSSSIGHTRAEEADGPVRLVSVQTEQGGKSSCLIRIDGAKVAYSTTRARGEIATCSAMIH